MSTATIDQVDKKAEPELTNAQIVAKKYRAMAKYLEQHPDLPIGKYHQPELTLFASIHAAEDEDEKQFMARVAKIVGKGKKQYTDSHFKLIPETPEGTKIEVYADRESTCKRVQVGTKKVVKPAVPEQIIPAKPEETIEVPEYEWDCGGILEPDAQGRS